MDIEQVRNICLGQNAAVEEDSPFADLGHPDLAFKIGGKIFAYLCLPGGPSCQHADTADLVVLKSNPDAAIELRDQYPGIIEPAWHWNKKYWNQIRYNQLPTDTVKQLIAESFRLVFDKLPKSIKSHINL